ncbi:hypothetical protein [Actinoplanes derwentensis]|uniref:Uncharacterized protein n=1 Tax=Actinoplanes derwentensis TaxID=113562 RepID=A0A1H2DEA8_9ACTN|nr:hypothetical protein [Actinoplanes derwentensis]GID84862.1 hypothetical protein Ade03nite_37860 [Actinoplanes derwentensis]SDT80919.1 hypothetical protein SAMN04489716_9419 [Actinoplanes derwentensis]
MTDSSQPPNDSADPTPAPAPRKPRSGNWIFPIGGGVVGAYFLINGALGVRETQGNGVFALMMAGIVILLGVLGTAIYRSYRS